MGATGTSSTPDGSQDGRYGSPDRRAGAAAGMAPDTPFAQGQTPLRPDSSAGASPAPSSLGHGPGTPGLPPPHPHTGEFQGSLRRMTNNLMEMFDQMSSKSVLPSGAGGSAIGQRGDSVATIADLESGDPKPAGDAESMNPVQMRRLTTGIVDVLRQLQASGGAGAVEDPEIVVARHRLGLGKDDVLLPDNVSELSLDDKLSLISGGTSTSGKESYSSLNSHTALLKGWGGLKTDEDYKGDTVHPWYVDLATHTSSLRDGDGDATPKPGADDGDHGVPTFMQKQRKINIWGTCVAVIFFCAFFFYVGIRIKYGILVLAVEMIGGLAQMPYAVCLTMRVVNCRPPAPDEKGVVRTLAPYHIRVLIPCYKEPLDVVSKTVMAALFATVPANCQRTVYLLDDGRDPEKRKFIHSLRVPNAVYVSGRKRAPGEMNGKSANINNAARALYPGDGAAIPLTEVLCVFDADQVPNADFYQKMVPMLDGGQDVGMVLSPQTFYNLNPEGDVFNHANVHFWDYTQPGYDALGLISCTGTNFLVRARAFADAGWFPEWTLTEDFALGIELKRRYWQCRYVQEYLAIGEAPDDVRNCFQQRSRWSKGHFQTFFSRHNPVIQSGLSPLMRWMYGSVILAYFSAFLGTPLLMLVPMITVWFGSFPIVINFWAAVCITVYYGATLLLNYYTHSFGHLKSMWFTGVSNCILWYAFLKAMYRSTLGRYIDGSIVFKVTAKGLQRMGALPLRDVWMAAFFFVTMIVTLIFGLIHYSRGPASTPLVISLIFMALNLVPNYLLLQYALFRRPAFFNIVCRVCMLLMTFLTIFGIVLVWVLYPRSYNFPAAVNSSLVFMNTQRVGALPNDLGVSWRGSALTQEASCVVWVAYNSTAFLLESGPWDLEGGWVTGMDAGALKATLPIAFSTAVMAWGYESYTAAFSEVGAADDLLSNIRWGSDYLLKTVQAVGGSTYILSRIGSVAEEELLWRRLEDITAPRPAYVVDMAKGASDLGGSVAAALAASSVVFSGTGDTAYAATLLAKAKSVYAASTANLGYYSVQDWNISAVYNSSTFYDDLAWGAAWLFKATADDAYLSDVYDYYVKHLEFEAAVSDFKFAFDWDNVFWPANVLLAQETGGATFLTQSELYLKSWICSNMAANYTEKGRAYNAFSASLGSTMNTAFAALALADVLGDAQADTVFTYRCWGLAQVRYVLGDSGRSLTVGVGKNPPTRTQDRDAACPEAPQVCNRVTGLLSPEEDTHVLEGSLVYGSGRSDDFADVRDSTATRVGIESNAGYIGALAGVSQLDDGMWELCLQKFGIYRQSPICGSFINV
ncbi:hypothetical protein APUTEX25_003595 [Auxenochlorella protothecoides]|uniref:cellulase n=1 Tax=Auxenochlorella protothecoides TaxID=3075 RepID=A0A3M7L368_AUXPR|nr:hypothetical protein APUTEX25_003595 [Auxenochlorella protothecoides]|eukprot:RMZ57138.1 hypothetical protein APUTEX25_003595 [Auxenochlorella protothecoides]